MILAFVLKTTGVLQDNGFKLAANDFDDEQARLLLKGQVKTRKYKVLETAKGAVTQPARNSTMEMMHEIPLALQDSSYHAKVRSQLFRMLSAFSCSVESTLERYQRIFPYTLLKILLGREAAHQVYSMKVCLRDELATHFFEKYPTVESGLSTPATAFLLATAFQAEVDTCLNLSQICWIEG